METSLAIKWLVVATLLGVIVSLAIALWSLVRDKGKSTRMVRALTFRIGLSIALFLLLMLGIFMGIVVPHGVTP